MISYSPYCLLYSSCDVSLENLVLDQLIIPKFIFFFFSHHLSASYCIDIVRINSVLDTHGSKRVKEDLKSNTLEGNFFGGGG